ncbi:hypothetical protein D3C76_803140 [compost metagenome]|uniref:hypothetical protein n=1 Tax=Aeromonas rivipollensis TaxID=948519 RepID=UPI000FBBE2AA|nr:hypothetical protein [Aeromonas rivipollensis]MDM5083746.1 hypothetical protein [Aeromonas rivipollensis]MDM5096124.1 hypothetical protein [Aeromonas rivipollensis]MDM5104323.1 hypothetical protein [Aeromonas rivipollensis]
MTFIDLNLMSSDAAAMGEALRAAGFTCSESSVDWHHPEAALLMLPPGMISRPTGAVQTVAGVEMPVREPVPGYHANVRTTDAELAAALAPVTIIVETPQYVWA